MMIPAGGAVRVSRASRLMNDAISAAGSRLNPINFQPDFAVHSSDLRGCQKGIEESEEAGSVFNVQNVPVK